MSKTAFISTAIPYVNSRPHIGFAFECVQTDAMARYLRLMGYDTYFLTGSDENSLKNVRAAKEEGISTQELCDRNTQLFVDLKDDLNLSNDEFIRTSGETHHKGAQELWSRFKPEDVYKKHYTGLYCVGCEDFYSEKDLPDKICPDHGTPLEVIEEENYFFKLSNYENQLLELIESGDLRIVPKTKRNEILSFIKGGLLDFSISRSRKRAGDWGVTVPGDEDQVMYVWLDALANYITALDLNEDSKNFQDYWLNCPKRVHMIGKGINRFHTIYWPAMLISAGLPVPTDVFVHGYLTINGQKISKSLGNVIEPSAQIEQYGLDPVRYFLLKALSPFEDGDYSDERFREVYNADLANNLGNLARRIETIGAKAGHQSKSVDTPVAPKEFTEAMDDYRFNEALSSLWAFATELNQRVEEVKPWVLQKAEKHDEVATFLDEMIDGLRVIGHFLQPFMPDTAEKLLNMFPAGKAIERGEPLFPRLVD